MIKEEETTKDEMISLCGKMYCASDITEEKIKFSCKGSQKDGNKPINGNTP